MGVIVEGEAPLVFPEMLGPLGLCPTSVSRMQGPYPPGGGSRRGRQAVNTAHMPRRRTETGEPPNPHPGTVNRKPAAKEKLLEHFPRA